MTDDVIHIGRPKGRVRPVNFPLDFASTYIFDSLADYEAARKARFDKGTLNYARYGTESTFALEDAIAQLEGGFGAIAVSSGLAAITMAILPFATPGAHILVANSVYGPTRSFCIDVLGPLGVETEFFDPMDVASINRLLRPATRLVVLEAPGSNTFEVPDIRAFVAAAKSVGAITILDNTWSTPIFLKPLSLGVDVSVHSGSKYLSGHSDVMIGFIVAGEACYHRIRRTTLAFGERASPAEIFLTARGLRTLEVRMKRHDASARAVAEWLTGHPLIEKVLHPALPSCPGHDNWRRDFSGAAGVFSFLMAPCPKAALHDFVDGLELFGIGLSWGGFESLILPADVAAARTAPPWPHAGQLIRLSIGLEDPAGLIADLEAGLARIERH